MLRVIAWSAVISFGILVLILNGLMFAGFQHYKAVSGSMSPAIKTSSMILVRAPGEEIRVGDVIIFDAADEELPIMHRVVEIQEDETGTRRLITKGDANDSVDSWDTTSDNVLGKVVLVILGVGYPLHFLFGTWAVKAMVSGIILSMLLILLWKREKKEE